jgi:argininosuccinate lyase
MQLLKELLFPAFVNLKDCIRMIQLMLSNVVVKENLLADEKYKFLFSVEEVNKLVLSGMPFRDAYKQVGLAIEKGEYNPANKVNHSHEGSIGNLCTTEISKLMDDAIHSYNFEHARRNLKELLC